MKKIILFILLGFLCLCLPVFGRLAVLTAFAADEAIFMPLDLEPIQKSDRILILAPHPDDETIACAGIIQKAISVGASVNVMYLTNGDHNELAFIVFEKRITFRKNEFIYMGEIRKKEAIKAMKSLGLDEKKLIFLGYPDFGTFVLFRDYWQSAKPYKSILTRVSSVPYKDDFSYGSGYLPENALVDIERVLQEVKPTKIFVSHPADTNYDHKTLYLFLEVALADLKKELPAPKVYPYLIHCSSWPMPRHYHPELTLTAPDKFIGSEIGWKKFDLTQEQLTAKYKAILCYRSQTRSSAFYLLAFARKNELFGDYPQINAKIIPKPAKEKEGASFKDTLISVFNPRNLLSGTKRENDSQSLVINKNCAVDYWVDNNSLIIHLKKRKDQINRFNTLAYLFGYSYKTPFAQMPKIRITTKYNKFRIFDGKKLINPEGVGLELKNDELILKIPFGVLGNPDFILASFMGDVGTSCVDALGFRKVNITGVR